jgi:hypothetical protein
MPHGARCQRKRGEPCKIWLFHIRVSVKYCRLPLEKSLEFMDIVCDLTLHCYLFACSYPHNSKTTKIMLYRKLAVFSSLLLTYRKWSFEDLIWQHFLSRSYNSMRREWLIIRTVRSEKERTRERERERERERVRCAANKDIMHLKARAWLKWLVLWIRSGLSMQQFATHAVIKVQFWASRTSLCEG